MHSVALVGASGYAGVELLRLIERHPRLELTCVAAGRSAGQTLGDSWAAHRGTALGARVIEEASAQELSQDAETIFLALPHGVSTPLAAELVAAGCQVIDLGADFRLKDPQVWAKAYGAPHGAPELLERAVYGLAEASPDLEDARLIAAPGCYPTAVALAAMPLLSLGVDWVLADCLSGVSGAGRKASARTHFCEVNESVSAYGLAGTHRHTVEMEQQLGVPVHFTPHLVPMQRGLLATVHVKPERVPSPEALRELMHDYYADSPLVTVRDEPPATSEVRGTARAIVHAAVDLDRGLVTAVCAIDNLLKGAGAQAVQALNLSLGWPEALGLPLHPVLP